jgi:hypothetical protein
LFMTTMNCAPRTISESPTPPIIPPTSTKLVCACFGGPPIYCWSQL